jgi:hypothetical protein
MTTPLSPDAQAVMDAAFPAYDDETLYVATGEQHAGMIAAAALRAVADLVVPELDRPRTADERTLYHEGRLDAVIRHRKHLLAIAAELDNSDNTSEGIMAITQPVPVRTPDGKIHEFILNVDGKRFFCPCNCNVFHKPDDRDLELYQCNCCGTQFNSP